MLKTSVTIVIVGLLFFNIAFAQDSTSTNQDLLDLIKQLQAQIQSLQAQIVDLHTEVQSVKTELKFSRALAQGATGDDVKQLQEFLKTFTGAYPNGLITGYFGPLTEVAVKKFQEQNNIESIGIVGPKTQEKLSVLAAAIPATPAIPSSRTGIPAIPETPALTTPVTPCKTPSSVQVPFTPTIIKVISPNGGEQWQVGGTYTIKYSAKDVAGNKALLVYLNKGYDEPTTKTGVNSSQLVGVTTNLESYTYTVPNNIQSWPGLGSNYTISIYIEGSYSSCNAISYIGDFSDATFSIVAAQVGAPTGTSTPTIKSTTPTTQYTPTLLEQISALQNQLNNTTDAATQDSLKAQITALQAQVQALQSSSTTSTAQVQSLATSIKVLFPNGGETLTTGQTYRIKWTGGNNTVDIYLLDNPTRLGKKIFPGITNNGYVDWIASSLSSGDLYDSITGTYKIPSGQYIIFVGCTDNNCTVDDSDSYFKIIE